MDEDNIGQQFYGSMQGIDTISSNQGYNSALQLRLDCNQILSDINDFLNGTSTYQDYDEEKKINTTKQIQIGEPIANKKGIQAIMLRCRSIFNPQSVQGNFDDARYNLYIKFLRQELALEIVGNRYKWDIKSERVNDVVDKVMNFAKPFMSRTLYNKERESYAQTVQSKETHQIIPNEQTKSKWGF